MNVIIKLIRVLILILKLGRRIEFAINYWTRDMLQVMMMMLHHDFVFELDVLVLKWISLIKFSFFGSETQTHLRLYLV